MNKRLKIFLFVDWFYPVGGVETFVQQLAQGLAKNNTVYTMITYPGRKIIPPALARETYLIEIPKTNTAEAIEKVILKQKPDIVHINNPSRVGILGLRAAKKYKIPAVITNHLIPDIVIETNKFITVFSPILWRALRYFNKNGSAVTAPSRLVRKRLWEKIGIKNIKVISCGVDTKRFRPGDKEVAKKNFHLPPIPLILYVGRFSREKGLDLLVKAAPRVCGAIDVRFVLAGFDGGVLPALKSKIKDLDLEERFIFIDWLPHDSEGLTKIYQAADLFVIPSVFETQSIVTLEAMASGLPIVASRSGALPDLVKNNVNGFLVKKGNAEDLALKIIKIMRDPELREKMGEQSRKLALAHDMENTIAGFEKIYRSLLRRKIID
jgi:glycosyltransferase involved in cell wall biosynthesis